MEYNLFKKMYKLMVAFDLVGTILKQYHSTNNSILLNMMFIPLNLIHSSAYFPINYSTQYKNDWCLEITEMMAKSLFVRRPTNKLLAKQIIKIFF